MTNIFKGGSLLAACFLVLASSFGCQQGSAGEVNHSEPASSEAHAGESEANSVEYEPAYPADVSTEDLNDDDIAQQATTHSHDGGEEHSHDDDDGDHEEGADDDHDH